MRFKNFVEKMKVSQDRDVDELPGTQPSKYYSGVDKDDKEKRAKQFARQAKMDDDDPRAYKPAPGDKDTKTKPSKHTNKFKQMYGERELTPAEKDKMKEYEKKIDKKDFIDRYGEEEGERIYYATITKMAKKNEAVSPAQQAAIAIAKKNKAGKPGYDSEGKSLKKEADPCWDGYKQVGMKKKNGKMVPNCVQEEVSQKQINDLEKFADRILAKFDIDVEFTRHFVDRMNDKRNSPEIKVAELQKLFKKIQKNKGKNIKGNAGIEAVLKDISSDLNLPVVIKTKGDEIELVNKTIMRKKDFKTPSKVIKYEQFSNMDEASRADMRVRKRPHMMLKAGNAGVKFDGRFKMYKKKQTLIDDEKPLKEDFHDMSLINQVKDLMEDTEHFIYESSDEALKKKADKTGMPLSILKKVFDRGVAAWRTGHRPGTTPTQWGLARVNSFATKSKGTWGKADADLAKKVRSEEIDEEKELEKILTTDGRMKSFKEKLKKLGYKKMDEGKSSTGYELYHKDFSSAMQHAYKHAKDKLKIEIDPEEIDNKVATGPRKPSKGKSNTYRLTDKSGKKAVHIQVYNMDNKSYELNMYKEDVDFVVELTAAEKKLINQMYDKKGNLTPLGKKVMDHGKSKKNLKAGLNFIGREIEEKKSVFKPEEDAALMKLYNKAMKQMPGSPAQKKTLADIQKHLMDVSSRIRKEDVEIDLEEGVNDPGIFKAVFLAGGPGSGKSFMVGKTALTTLGLKLINSDPAFEAQLKKAGLQMNPDDIFSDKGQEARAKAKRLTTKQQEIALKGRLGLVIDGTGKDYDKIANQASDMKKMGYDVAMIFVNTNLETAINRDAKRSRTLGAKEVTKMWNGVQDNIGKFQRLFGNMMIVVDNSDGADWKTGSTEAYKKMQKWVASKPKSPMAKKWIKTQKDARGITESELRSMMTKFVETKDEENLSKLSDLFGMETKIVRESVVAKKKKVPEYGRSETTVGYKKITPGESVEKGATPQRFSQRIRENIMRKQRRR